jgi:hypothetical protein
VDESIEWLEGRFGVQDLAAQKWDYVLDVILNGKLDGGPPNRHQVLVADNPISRPYRGLVPADTFEPRWEEILHLGYADWVNVGPPRVVDGHLTVEVVYASGPHPGHGTSDVRRYRRDTIWIELYVMDPTSSTYRFPHEIAFEPTETEPEANA